jgi:hypothetical protein
MTRPSMTKCAAAILCAVLGTTEASGELIRRMLIILWTADPLQVGVKRRQVETVMAFRMQSGCSAATSVLATWLATAL